MSEQKLKVKKPPYLGTEIDANRSKGDILQLLEKHGIKQKQWQDVNDESRLTIIWERKDKDGKPLRTISYEFEPPKIYVTRKLWSPDRGRMIPTEVRNRAAEMRALYWYLEAKLNAITWGLIDIETEFVGQMLIPTEKEGELKTVGAAIRDNVKKQLPIRLQLEGPSNG